MSDFTPLSASKIKTLDGCSWMYHCNYMMHIPQAGNDGSRAGSITHLILESLIKDRRSKQVKTLLKDDTIRSIPAIEKLVKKRIIKEKLPVNEESFNKIDKMILVGLKSDFKPKNCVLIEPEYKFDISTDRFRIKGFMDKPFFYGKTKVLIDDYKTSKVKFKGEEKDSNVQALMYSYAAKTIWPNLSPVVRFIFLQFPKDPIMSLEFNNDTLKGFEEYLAFTQKKVECFDECSAKSNFAADYWPEDGSFHGKLLCGMAKQPRQLKKDGTKMFACEYKFAFDYWEVTKDGKYVYSVRDELDLKPLKEGEVVQKKRYNGCPRHQDILTSMQRITIDDF